MNKNENGGKCSCCQGGWCGHGGMHHFSILRMLLAVILVCAIFSAGVRLGEIKGYIRASGYGMHQNGLMNQPYNQ